MPPLDLYLNMRLADFEARLQERPWKIDFAVGPRPGQSTRPRRPHPPEPPESLDLQRAPRLPELPVSRAKTGAQMIQQACNKLVKQLKPRARGPVSRPLHQPSQKLTAIEEAREVISGWLGQAQSTTDLMLEAWEARWKRGFHPDPLKTTQPADTAPTFSDKALKRHENLTKAESSLLIQARTGAIGLNDFLFRARVPEISTPYYKCS